MSPLASKLLAAVRRRALFGPGDRVAIALSGGSDSVALSWLLRELADARACHVAGLIHVNHLLRGDDSDADEAFCRALAATLAWPIEVTRVDVAARAREDATSLEVAARAVRYDWFAAAAARLDASVVVTAHTADDQAETVLMRLLAGAGTRGLAGIRPRRGIYARPLLDCRRRALRRYLSALGQPFREDASNQDRAIVRNRVRHELMPVVERLAPGGVRALARLADLAREDEDLLMALARDRAPESDLMRNGVDVAALKELPAPLARRVIREAAARAVPHARLGAVHIEAVRRLAASDRSEGQVDLPRLVVERRGAVLRFRPPSLARPQPFTHALSVPGRVHVVETGDVVAATVAPGVAEWPSAGVNNVRAVLQAAAVDPPFVVRSRRPGDRFRPLGAPGRRTLQDLFVDRKVPREERDRVPIVVDARGRILWVAGVAVADECRVTAPEAGVVILELERSQDR